MAGPAPAVAAVRAAVRTALADLTPGDLVLVACSGGPDSLALAAGTGFVAARAGLRAGAVVVDHQWHPDSAAVAARAADTCRGFGLDPVDVLVVDAAAGPGGDGPEAAARTARYRALTGAADRYGAAAVLLGHTRDDQAETVLLGLVRGSGARSLAGMPARRGVFRRPLLDLSREGTGDACAALGLAPWQDPANADPAYARARLRPVLRSLAQVLGPGLPGALARSAALLREDADALDALAGRLLGDALPGDALPGDVLPGDVLAGDVLAGDALPGDVLAGDALPGDALAGDALPGDALPGEALRGGPGPRPCPGSGPGPGPDLDLDVSVLAAAPPAVRRRALLAAIRRAGAPPGAVGRVHVLAVDALVVAWRGQGPAHLPGGIVARRDCGRLLLAARGDGPRGDGRE